MLPTFLILIVSFHCVLFFLDVIFKTCMFFPYLKLLHDAGMYIKPFSITFETTHLNRMFLKFGRWKPTFLHKWFEAGVYLIIICIVPSLICLTVPFVQYLLRPSQYKTVAQYVVPVIPGLSLPGSHVFYYIVVLFVSVVIHEAGHAIAASRERIPIDGCGVAVFLFLPIAYVRLPTDYLNQLSLWQQMRIYSAGIWHNFVLAIFGIILFYSSAFLMPLFHTGNGVTVIGVTENSGAAQPGGLILGDNIIGINDCRINTREDWKSCLEEIIVKPQPGFCISEKFIALENTATANTSLSQCCPDIREHLCFRRKYASDSNVSSLLCLPGRKVMDNSEICAADKHCDMKICVHPIFDFELGRFVKIHKHNKVPTLYLGSIHDLYSTVIVTRWVSKYGYLPAYFADMFDTFLMYLVACSSGLALMNIVPCYFLDGQHLVECIVHYFLSSVLSFKMRSFLITILKIMGLLLTIFMILLALLK